MPHQKDQRTKSEDPNGHKALAFPAVALDGAMV